MRRWLRVALVVALLAVGMPVLADVGTSTTIGKDFVLGAGEQLAEDLIVFGGSARLHPGSIVLGNVTAVGGDTVVEGRVSGDVVVLGGITRLTATAVIDGDLVVFGTVQREQGATVHGNVIEGGDALQSLSDLGLLPISPPAPAIGDGESAPQQVDRAARWLGELGRRIAAFLFAVVLAALIAALLPGPLERTADVMRTSWALSLGMGLLTLVLVVFLTVIFGLLALVCIGIPLLVLLGVTFVLGGLLGWVAAGCLVGQYLASILHFSERSLLVETVLGTAALTFMALLPCVGPVVTLVALCWGLGGAAVANVGALQDLPNRPFGSGGPSAPHHRSAAESRRVHGADGLPSRGDETP